MSIIRAVGVEFKNVFFTYTNQSNVLINLFDQEELLGYIMCCIVEIDGIRFNFVQNKFKQKLLIKILLKYNHLDLFALSKILNISDELLKEVSEGTKFLSRESAQKLGKLFLLALSHPGR